MTQEYVIQRKGAVISEGENSFVPEEGLRAAEYRLIGNTPDAKASVILLCESRNPSQWAGIIGRIYALRGWKDSFNISWMIDVVCTQSYTDNKIFNVGAADKLENPWTNTQSWNTQRYSGVYTMCSNTSDGVSVPSGSPDRYWSGLNVGTGYTQFQVATYGGGTDAAQFSFRRQSDTGGNEDWTPWYEMFCGIRKYENLTLPTDGSGIQIATAKEVETFKWILLDLNKYQDGIGDCHIMTISLSEKYNKTVMVPYYGSPAFIYMQLDFNDSGLYASISSGSGTFRIKGMTIFK